MHPSPCRLPPSFLLSSIHCDFLPLFPSLPLSLPLALPIPLTITLMSLSNPQPTHFPFLMEECTFVALSFSLLTLLFSSHFPMTQRPTLLSSQHLMLTQMQSLLQGKVCKCKKCPSLFFLLSSLPSAPLPFPFFLLP